MPRQLLSGALVALAVLVGSFDAYAAVPDARIGRIALAVALEDRCLAASAVVATAKKEAARVWAAAGVRLRWTTMATLPYRAPSSEWLVVRCTDVDPVVAPGDDTRVLAVAAIRFIGSDPSNTIVVNLGHARFLLQRDTPRARDLDARFRFVRERRLGRMVGRAIAHEIGHFLTRSGEHTEKGLMRAKHSVAAFTGDSLNPFRVDGIVLAPPLVAADATARSDDAVR